MKDLIPSFVTNPAIYLPGNYNSYVVLDFETTYDPYDPSAVNPKNEIVLACWTIVNADGSEIVKSAFKSSLYQDELVKDCESADFLVAHNSKFEAGYLQKCGLDLRKTLIYCTMLGEWVRFGNLKASLSLNDTAARYKLGRKDDLVSTLIKKGVCASTIPQDWLLKYCLQDVKLCHDVFKLQRDLLHTTNRLHLAHTRNLTAICLADIEKAGMHLDPVRVEAEYKQTLRRRNWLRRELSLLTGNINLNSSQQIGVYLYDVLKFRELSDTRGALKTATGQRMTDSGSLSKLEPETEAQANFLKLFNEYNKCDSLLTKNLEFFYKTCKENKATFYAKLRQGVTATHRLASSGIPTLFIGEKETKSVQFQNLPRIYKKLFWAGNEDWIMGECDGAQLEFRVAGDVGHDKTAYNEIINEVDVHSITAQTLTTAGEPTTRQEAKASTFAPLFGGMGKTKAQKAYATFFKEKYVGIAKTQSEWCLSVGAKKYLILPWGMRFFFPEASINKWGRLNCLTNVSNYPIQSFATGEIIPIALVYFWYRCVNTSIVLQNTIHDSIVGKLKKQDAEIFEQLSKQCLTTDVYNYLKTVYNYTFQVPLGVGIKLSRNWGDTKTEIKYSVDNKGVETRTVESK